MSNGIAMRQNEDNSIAMLAAQRQLYRDAKKYNTVAVALSVWILCVHTHATLFVTDLHRHLLQMTASKHPCADTLCLSHSTQRRAAAAVALTSGTEYRKMLNLLLPNKKK